MSHIRPRSLVSGMILLAVLLGPSPVSAFTFVSNGRPACTIILPANASSAEVRAADLLVSGIERITRARIPVERAGRISGAGGRVLLGRGSWLSLPQFRECRETLDVVGAQGFIVEPVGRGAGESITVTGGSSLGTEYAVQEILRRLGVRWYAPGMERLPHTRTLAISDTGIDDFPCFPYRSIRAVSSSWRELLRLDPPGPDGVYAPLEIALDDLITPEVIARYPEVLPTIGGSPSAQFGLCCFTGYQALSIIADGIIARLGRTSGTTHVILDVNHPGLICRCSACARIIAREGEPGLALSWYNALAGRIGAKYPRVSLVFSDPWSRGPLPRTIRPRKNVTVRLSALSYGSVAGAKEFETSVNRWTASADRVHLTLPFASPAGAPIPFRNLGGLARELGYARDRNVEGIFFELPVDGLLVADAGMRAWVFSELLWDPDRNMDALVREWIRGACGNAASAVTELQTQVRVLDGKSGSVADPLAGVDDAWLDSAERIMQRAYAMSLSDRAANREVRRMRLGLWYARFSEEYMAIRRGKVPDSADRAKYVDLLAKFEMEAREFGIERVSPSEKTGDFVRRIRTALRSGRGR